MKFSYQARTKEGEIQAGFIEASSRDGALSVLQRYGLYVTYLIEVKEPFWQKRVEFFRRTSRKDIVFFTRQLSIMLKSNIPVVESLEIIARQTKKFGFQEVLLKMAEQVEGGFTLSQCLSSFSNLFSAFFIGMVKSGEASGRVPESLDYLADYLEKEQDFVFKLVGALIYPLFILFVFSVIVLAMSIFVIPQFQEIFAEMGGDVPFATKMLFRVAGILKSWWWLLGLFFLGLCLFMFFLFRSKELRNFFDSFSLEIPLLGGLLQKFYLTRIALNLSTLISGGVPISDALQITGDVVANQTYKNIILETRDGVRAGKSISSVLSGHPEKFPFLFLQMTIVGEKTGHLESSLQNVVSFYQKEVDRTLETFIKFLEPGLIACLGVLVIILALSLFVPLFQRGLSI